MAGGTDAAPPQAPQLKVSQIVPLVVMLGLGKMDLDEMGYRRHTEVLFVIMQLLGFGVLAMIHTKIAAMADDGKKIDIPEVKQFGQVVAPATKQTPKEYDQTKLKEQAKQALMGFLVVGLVYYKWQYLMPLVLQAIMGPVQLYESPLFQVHLMKATVKRPYPAPNPLGLPSAPEAPAVTEKAEKADKSGKSEKSDKAEGKGNKKDK
mmetsp:Transcript_54023/g.106668  ORF Transcript_54023/g.106668 Transcript_54023/m.106668 type:complete len:206 (+) Transcript_54023:104-721(+)